jgi:hypothetical protein
MAGVTPYALRIWTRRPAHKIRIYVLHNMKHDLVCIQLPPLPDPDKPNGFPSLDVIPEEYYETPPFENLDIL